jgi:hypothetical protein
MCIRDRIQTIVDKIYIKAKNHLSSFNNYEFISIEKILGVLILERIIGNLNSIKFLLDKLWCNPDVEPSIGLIMRNNLSLCKIIFKQKELIDRNENLETFYKVVFGENIQRTIKQIKKHHTQKEIQPHLDIIKKKFAFLLKETKIDIDNIENEKLEFKLNLTEKFSSLENLFMALSKYEHFGLNTIILQGNDEWNEKLERFEISVHYSLQGILICLLTLEIIDNELIQLYDELAKNTNA